MTTLFDNPTDLVAEPEPPEPPRRRADIVAQGKCLTVLQRAGARWSSGQ